MDKIRNVPLTGIKPVSPATMLENKLPEKETGDRNKYPGSKKQEKPTYDFRKILEEELEKQKNPKNYVNRFDSLRKSIQ